MSAKKIAANTLFLSLARFVGMVFSFAVVLLISRFFGPAALGQYNLALSVAAFFIIFSDAGISTIIVRELSKKRFDRMFFSDAFLIKLFLSVFSLAVSSLLILFFARSFEAALFLFLIVFSFILDSFSLAFRSVFNAFQEMHLEAIVFVSQKIVFAVFSAALIFFGFDLIAVAIAFALSTLFSFFLSCIFFFRLPHRPLLLFSLRTHGVILASAIIPFIIIGFLSMVSSKLDILLVKFFLQNDSLLGFYSAPKSLFDALFVVELGFFAALFPQLSMLFSTDKKKFSLVVSGVMKMLFVFSAPVIIVSVVFSQQVVELFFGAQFLQASSVFAVCSVTLAFLLFYALLSNLLFIANLQKLVGIIFAISIFFLASFSFFFIPAFGINGAALSMLFSVVISFLLSLIAVKGFARIDFSFLPKLFFVSIFCFALIFAFSFWQSVFSPAFSVVFAPLFFFFFCLESKEQHFLLESIGIDKLLKGFF